MSAKLKSIDLFAGTGAFTLALESSGLFETVYANDMDKNSSAIFKLNHPNVKFELGNLNDIDVSSIPPHDILCGGFPCQPWIPSLVQKQVEA